MREKERVTKQTTKNSREEQEREEQELEEFGRKLLPYYHRFMDYVSAASGLSSRFEPEQMRANGLRYRSMRKERGLLRTDVAPELGIDHVQLSAFESGLIPEEDMPEEFTKNLVKVLQAHPLKGGV